MATQAVAAREEKVSHLNKKRYSSLRKGMVPPVFVMASPVSLFLRSSSYRPVLMLATMGSALMLVCLLRLLDFFLIAQSFLFEGKREWSFVFQGSGSVVFVERFGVGQRGTNATNVGSRAVLAAVLLGALRTLIPKVWLVVCLKVFPVLRFLTRVWCMVLWVVVDLLNVPKPLPHLGVDPLCPLLLVLALVMCGLMKVLLCPLLPLCLRSLLIRFSPLGLLPVVPPPLPVGPVVDSVSDQLRAFAPQFLHGSP